MGNRSYIDDEWERVWGNSGTYFCPNCKKEMVYDEERDYWYCDTCNYDFIGEEAEDEGYPTLESVLVSEVEMVDDYDEEESEGDTYCNNACEHNHMYPDCIGMCPYMD